MIEFKMSHIEHSQKKYKDFNNQLNTVQITDQHAVFVAWRKIQKTSEWMNANEKKQQTILKHIKQKMMQKQENCNIDDR